MLPIHDPAWRVFPGANRAGRTTREYVWMETAAFAANDNGLAGGRLSAAESASDPFSPTQLPSLLLPRPWRDAPALPLAVIDNPASAPAILYAHADHLNRPVKMTDAAKASVWDAVYKPFGETHALTGTAALNLRFPGQHFQIETGLAYNGTGLTAPTGRYAQPDRRPPWRGRERDATRRPGFKHAPGVS